MATYRLLFLYLILAIAALGQSLTRKNIATCFDFENSGGGCPLQSWAVSAGDITLDSQVFHGGKHAVRIRRTAQSAESFTTILLSLPLDFSGRTIQWRGWVKTAGVDGAAALWLREDPAGGGTNVGFGTTQNLEVHGETEWTQYSTSVAIVPDGAKIFFGFLLSGTGTAWADDFELLVDGQPIALAANPVPTVFDTDHEFDAGSKIALSSLSDIQVKNLATLAKVWGFLKYHHPSVAAGERHWDYDLFRILPGVLAANDGASANTAIATWIETLGAVKTCSPCASLASDGLYMKPSLDWIYDESALGAALSQLLESIYRNRPATGSQFYIAVPNQMNPEFRNELSYTNLRLPDAGYQLLALFRYWNMVQYFYPNRDIIGGDATHAQEYWDGVIQQSIPRVALASDRMTYAQEMIRFIAAINDTHANLWNLLSARPPGGPCRLPVETRFIEGNAVVTRSISKSGSAVSELQAGDVIEEFDGVAVSDLVTQWTPLYADSNDAARMRDMGQNLTNGACGLVPIKVRRAGVSVNVSASRVPVASLDVASTSVHDRPGEAYQRLSDDVAYIKISTAKTADVASYIQAASGTKGLVIDLRDYPSDFPIYALGGLLVSTPTPFAKFTYGDVSNPGAFRWTDPVQLTPAEPHYNGKVVILVDEITQSSAEFHAMAFRAAPGAIVIGSTTAGADGNVSTVNLPGGMFSYISGIGVFYPDGRPTQRIGIVPDIEMKPTVLGVQAERDELLEEAIRQITGVASARPTISHVANAEGGGPVIAPNTWVTIYGSNLAPEGHTRTWQSADFASGAMPVQLDGVSATINGKSAYMYYISPTQINILAPADAVASSSQVVVSNQGAVSAPFTVQSDSISPSLFVASGSYVLATHGAGGLVGPVSLSTPGYPFTPAQPGETIVLYGNGFGPTSTAAVNGAPTQAGTLDTKPAVTVGGMAASVEFAGLISPGLYQINIVVPAGLADGEHPVSATYKGASTQAGLALTLRN